MRFKRVIKAASKDGYFRNNPAEDVIAKSNRNKKIKEILTADEYQQLLNTNCGNYEVKKAFVFSLYIGLRWADVKPLKWENIKPASILLKQIKTEVPLEVPLHDIALHLLGERKEGLVFHLPTPHQLMGICNELSSELETIINNWSKVKISDPEVKKLIQLAMIPNKEVFNNIQEGKDDDLSTCFKNICDTAFKYAMSNPSQQQETTKGTLPGAYNAVTGYFQNVRTYKDDEAKLKSLFYGGTAQQRSQKAFNLCSNFFSS